MCELYSAHARPGFLLTEYHTSEQFIYGHSKAAALVKLIAAQILSKALWLWFRDCVLSASFVP